MILFHFFKYLYHNLISSINDDDLWIINDWYYQHLLHSVWPLLPLLCFTPCCLSLSLSASSMVVFVFCSFRSLPLAPSLFLWLQDYSTKGQSRCELDYEAEISLRSSCPAVHNRRWEYWGQDKLWDPPVTTKWYSPALVWAWPRQGFFFLVGSGPEGMLTHGARACQGSWTRTYKHTCILLVTSPP